MFIESGNNEMNYTKIININFDRNRENMIKLYWL